MGRQGTRRNGLVSGRRALHLCGTHAEQSVELCGKVGRIAQYSGTSFAQFVPIAVVVHEESEENTAESDIAVAHGEFVQLQYI